MSSVKDEKKIKLFLQKRTFSVTVIILNIVLLTIAALSYGRYLSVYQERLIEENLGNIANLNRSSALNVTALIDSWSVKLTDVDRYISVNDLTLDEALTVIEQSNSSRNRQFELIGSDYTGYLARRDDSGGFIPLSYEAEAYAELKKAIDDKDDSGFEDVCFAPEFTDSETALKYFAVYRHLPIRNEAGEKEIYTLLLATKSKDILDIFDVQSSFEGLSTILMDSSGNYIVSNNDFKSTNFFHYLHVYNDLTLDKRTELEREVMANGRGELYYKNAVGKDCVFRYERMKTNGWFCVTAVPMESFRTPKLNANYMLNAVFALVFIFIIDAVWLQRMNKRLRASVLREMEASDAKTDFLSRMSHDIRTPINGIIGLTALALNEETSPRVREYLENINVSGQFLTGLVNDILDLSKVESGKVELNPEPYSSRDLYKYVKAVAEPLCKEKGLEFRLQPPDDEPPVLLDRLRFNQILFNLLSNAVKYTPAGGFVELSWKREPLPEGHIVLELSVRDNGIGMSEEFQKHMFESFTQERSQTANTGTGLGLAIVHSLVSLMNGEITVKSKQGEGSTFTVRLERAVCKEAAVAAPKAEYADLKGKRVLLCEDNQINILVAQRMLEMWGVEAEVAVNGKEAVEKFTDSEPFGYDAVLMDVLMPEMNGLDATQAIRKTDRPDAAVLPIIAMTANAYESDVKNCIDAGMNAHMGKPIDHEQLQKLLAEQIAEALNKRKQ